MLNESKALGLQIKALLQKGRNPTVILCGPGRIADDITDWLKELGLEDRFHIISDDMVNKRRYYVFDEEDLKLFKGGCND